MVEIFFADFCIDSRLGGPEAMVSFNPLPALHTLISGFSHRSIFDEYPQTLALFANVRNFSYRTGYESIDETISGVTAIGKWLQSFGQLEVLHLDIAARPDRSRSVNLGECLDLTKNAPNL
ncbi:hypothetical protein MPER_04369, partial [Moniliophthora perniciosa FA553]